MTTRTTIRTLALAVLVTATALGAMPAGAQQILLDKSVKAGELTLFPELGNESVFYYVPDKARLATDANGTPQFSFLRYVNNVRSGADQPQSRVTSGSGVVPAVGSTRSSVAWKSPRVKEPSATSTGPAWRNMPDPARISALLAASTR